MTEHEDGAVALIGGGTIGGGWAVTYLLRGRRVLVVDPAPHAHERLANYLKTVWPVASRTVADAPSDVPRDLWSVVPLGDAGAARLVHESGPESVPVKQSIYRDLEAVIGDDVPILSSSGGLMPTELQARMRRPERFVVAHPQSPVYAIRLVEVLAGDATSSETVRRAVIALESVGKRPVVLHKQLPGYLTNRLTFALLREAVHCLAEGVADAQAIEDAVTYGITPRFQIGGAITSLALAGGPGGMRTAMTSFAPAVEAWWADLGAPSLDPEIRELLVRAADEVLRGRSFEQLLKARDEAAVAAVELQARYASVGDR